MAWDKTIKDMTNNSPAAEVRPDDLPIGYIVKKEPKTMRRSFALQQSVIDALQDIAAEQGTNINALVNEILLNYVNDYLKK